jgi:hypothetical protein
MDVRIMKSLGTVTVGCGRLLLISFIFAQAGNHAWGQDDIVNFKVPDMDDQGKLTSMLRGEKARIVPGRPMEVEGLHITFYEDDGKTESVNVKSPSCVYDTRKGVATSDDKINIVGKTFTVDGKGFEYQKGRERITIYNNVKVKLWNQASLKKEKPISETDADKASATQP